MKRTSPAAWIIGLLFVSGTSFAQEVKQETKVETPPAAKVQAKSPEKSKATSAGATTPDLSSLVRFPIEKYSLPNGLTVILQEDHSAPIVSYQTWFRVGSKYEEPGFTGIAHLFEHMMFKGAKRYTGEKFESTLQANGGVNNAFTTQDYTGYYENLPSSKVELAADFESDRMENLQVTAENLKSEREVVKEERRFRVDNSPMGVLHEAMYGTLFKVNAYRWPVIGYMQDIDAITLEKATEFYHTYYAPNNAVVVIAGDIVPAEVKKLITKYYGSLKSQMIPNKPRPTEPAFSSPRMQTLTRDVQNTQFIISFLAPKAGTDESYALDLLANILGFGPSSRLHQRLVYKEQVATTVAAYNATLQDAGYFQIFASIKPGGSVDEAQRAIVGELWRPRNLLVSQEELQKAKNQVMKGYVDGLKTVSGKAHALALNEVLLGDYEALFKDLDRYNRVTQEQIRKVANQFLGPEKSATVILNPKGKK